MLPGWDHPEQVEEYSRTIEELSAYKLNFAYLDHVTDSNRNNWFRPAPVYKTGLQAIGRLSAVEGTFEFGQIINPYVHFSGSVRLDQLKENSRNIWYHSDPVSMNQLNALFRTGIQAGTSSVLLGTNDNLPLIDNHEHSYGLYNRKDRSAFLNLQHAHADMINQFYTTRNRFNREIDIEFIPPWYNNESVDMSRGRAEYYFSDLLQLVPYETSLFWSGGSSTSLVIDESDLERFRNYTGRNPVLMDNSLDARGRTGKWGGYTEYYPGKAIMCNLFEPYDTRLPDDFHLLNGHQKLFINYPASSELAKIKYATVADYVWNTAAYNPEKSLWKVLVSKFGQQTGKELIIFNEAYFNLLSICMIMEQTGVNNRLIRQGEETILTMDVHLQKINDGLIENPVLSKELTVLRDELVEKFNECKTLLPSELTDTVE